MPGCSKVPEPKLTGSRWKNSEGFISNNPFSSYRLRHMCSHDPGCCGGGHSGNIQRNPSHAVIREGSHGAQRMAGVSRLGV
jgi:hypothetical protein